MIASSEASIIKWDQYQDQLRIRDWDQDQDGEIRHIRFKEAKKRLTNLKNIDHIFFLHKNLIEIDSFRKE